MADEIENATAIETPIDNSSTQAITTPTVETSQEKTTIKFSDDAPNGEDNNTPKEEVKIESKVENTLVDKSKAAETTQSSFDFKSKFGDDFDSEEKIVEALKGLTDLKSKAGKADYLDKVPEHNKGLIEFVAKGGDAKTYLEAMSQDYDKMETKDILHQYWKINNSEAIKKADYTEEEAQELFEDFYKQEYGRDEDYDSPSKISMREKKEKATANELRDFLKEQQKESLKTPQAKIEDNNKKWLDLVETTAKGFKGITLKVAGEEINFKNETPDKLRDSMAGIDYNPETHAKAMYLAANFDKIIAEVEKKATDKAYKQGQLDYQKKLTNPQNIGDSSSPKTVPFTGNMTYEQANQIAKTKGVVFSD